MVKIKDEAQMKNAKLSEEINTLRSELKKVEVFRQKEAVRARSKHM